MNRVVLIFEPYEKRCPWCHGTGEAPTVLTTIAWRCPVCLGAGKVPA